jgi:hypothetical protein
MSRRATVRSKEEFTHLLRIGLAPITDDPSILIELGFSRSYPNTHRGFEATLWERSTNRGSRATANGKCHVLTRERAYLVSPSLPHDDGCE